MSAGVLLAIALPVVINGAPLADEYHLCTRPLREGGFGPYVADYLETTGVVRPAKFVEMFLIGGLCSRVPFGLIILVPLALKFTVAFLLLGLLRDLDLRAPWPEIGAAAWLLEPLGTEAALWPAALHVLLGLAFAVAALRLHGGGRHALATLATFGAFFSVEQAIFALPLAVWLVVPPERRRTATVVTAVAALTVIAAYSGWPGENPRQAMTLAQRLEAAVSKGQWYVLFPLVGVGAHSGALGVLWAFPASLALIAAGAWGGSRLGPILLATDGPQVRPHRGWWALAFGGLLALVNLPLVVTEVGYSARTFTPTWLVLCGALALVGPRIRWRRVRLVGGLAGTYAVIAVLSLALSASVRVETVAFNETALAWLAEQTEDGDVIAVCDVDRTAVEPAPLGAFHLHAFHSVYDGAINYHTGRVAEMRRSGERYWGARCPDLTGADVVVDFPDLQRIAGVEP